MNKNTIKYLILILVCFAKLYNLVYSTVISGFRTGEEFVYIGKFCFSWNPDMNQTIGYINGYLGTYSPNIYFVLYDDQDYSWPYIISNSSCDCKCKMSQNHAKHRAIIPNLLVNNSFTTLFETQPIHTRKPLHLDLNIHEHLRPRFWYLAAINCIDRPKLTPLLTSPDIKLSPQERKFSVWYIIEMTQYDGSQLPVYEDGLIWLYLIFSILSYILLYIEINQLRKSTSLSTTSTSVISYLFTSDSQSSFSNKQQKDIKDESFYPLNIIFVCILLLFSLYNTLNFLHFTFYSIDGIGLPFIFVLSKFIKIF